MVLLLVEDVIIETKNEPPGCLAIGALEATPSRRVPGVGAGAVRPGAGDAATAAYVRAVTILGFGVGGTLGPHCNPDLWH